MDTANFNDWDWFLTVVPWARHLERPKIVIVGNLSPHVSPRVIDICGDLNIRFVFLPLNSTDTCQPLNVSFFDPLKRAWRKMMEDYKIKKSSSTSLDKSKYPGLLNKVIISVEMKVPNNFIFGFHACDIVPIIVEAVLRKFQREAKEHHSALQTVLEYLQRFIPPLERS